MSRLKLFISHSSRLDGVEQDKLDEDHNWQLLKATCKALKDAYGNSIDILVDQDEKGLYPGCDWESHLNEWLAECHAAIILFSKRAAETSQWVKKEATILTWRREIESNFTLIPVMLKGQIKQADLEQDIWEILHVEKNQYIQDAESADDIVDGVKLALGAPGAVKADFPQTPFERVESLVTKLLKEGTDKQNLTDVWESLEECEIKPEWNPDETDRFSNALARYMLRDSQTCLQNFWHIINKLKPNPDQARAKELLKAIRALWVDTKAAGLIPISRRQQGMIAINGNLLLEVSKELNTNHYTLDRYLERAWPETDGIRTIPVTSTDVDEIQKEIRKEFGMQNTPIPPVIVDQLINDYSDPLFVYLHCSIESGGIPDPRVLNKFSKLRDIYKKLVFIFGTGEKLPEEKNTKILTIAPPLDLTLEATQFFYETQAKKLLNKKYGTPP
ncbi:MAG: toll/interleukin-1 receptor domain-containing protein [Chromatiales bacterium]